MTISSWLLDQLTQQGVEHICIAPGARCSPLVQAASLIGSFKLHVHFDERGLAFYALGLSKASQKPTAIIVTSGTAVGNLLPAIMEAHHDSIPLLILTADRPPELKECGANQATKQTNLFAPFVRWHFELPLEAQEHTIRSVAAQSYFATLNNPAGPVHLNCPLKEPLYDPSLKIKQGSPIQIQFPTLTTAPYHTKIAKGLILIGKLATSPKPILKLAEQLEWPVIADILSNARCTPTHTQIENYDFIDKPIPDLILHFGGAMTSKKLIEWQDTLSCEKVHIAPSPFLYDPSRKLTSRIQSDIAPFCAQMQAQTDPSWLPLWKQTTQPRSASKTFTEIDAMHLISKHLPPSFAVFLGNGMPIRDANHYLFPKQCKAFFGNRGLSGIDGNIATIAGLANFSPLFAIIGDQTALHDLNSLPLLKKTKYPVILVISNNFGGGIFHHLPISQAPHFETLWAAAHAFRFECVAHMFDIPYALFSPSIFNTNQTTIIELITDRKENHLAHAT